jgi:hypothetical protein
MLVMVLNAVAVPVVVMAMMMIGRVVFGKGDSDRTEEQKEERDVRHDDGQGRK